MYKKSIKYTDFDGVERTEDFYFNMSKSETIEWIMTEDGDLEEKLVALVKKKDKVGMFSFFKDFICRSYGVKTDDGKHFYKSEKITNDFLSSAAYDTLILELFSSEEIAADFFNRIIPDVPEEEKLKAEAAFKEKLGE